MIAKPLLACFERVTDSPQAIGALRAFMLNLAMRGKLVPQDSKDESAHLLLERIAAKRKELLATRGLRLIKADYGAIAIGDEFDLPPGWSRSTIGEVCDIQTGATPSRSRQDYFNGDIRWLRSGDVNEREIFDCDGRITRLGLESSNCKLLPTNCVLMALNGQGKTRGTVALLRVPAACNQSLVAIIPMMPEVLLPEFVFWNLRSRYLAIRHLTGHEDRRGLNMKLISCFRLPIPPVREQHRIVAKVDELMVLCDRLEEARAKREATRDRLTAASLARLNAPDPDPATFANHARFALNALPALTTRPDQIKQLRQTILNLAVRGKLVPQSPMDEPASKLLKSIAKEIDAYAKANRIAHPPAEPISIPPFPAPHGWQWARLCALFKVITDGDHQPPPRADEGVAFLTIGNVTTGRLDFTDCRLVPNAYYESLAPYRTPVKGDILYTVVGATLGRPAIVETDRKFCVQRHIAILKPVEAVSVRYLALLLASPLIYDQALSSATGAAQPTIALRPLRNFTAPIPPLDEQHRIVAMIDQLMSLCDQLEASLNTSDDTRRRLLDALLAEALTRHKRQDKAA